MKKTVVITGASSGIGKSAAKYFASKGWNVAATMRSPEKSNDLLDIPGVRTFRLDVTDKESIQHAINAIIAEFGGIDVMVNNAGYSLVGAFETFTPEQIQKQFDTNVFGVMNSIRAVLPHFRKRKAGTIITVTSVGGFITFPIYSVYHSTKWALEGFLEALQYELKPFNIKVKNIEPGPIKTDFYDRSMDYVPNAELPDYNEYVAKAYNNTKQFGVAGSSPDVVGKRIYDAAVSGNYRMRYAVGGNAPLVLFLRWLLPVRFLNWTMAKILIR